MQQILVPPSPNWYGAHMADWAPAVGLYAYAAQNTVVMLNSRAQTVRTMLSGHGGRVTAVAFAGAAVPGATATSSADQAERLPLLVSAAADRSLRLWNLNTMQRLRALYKRPAEVTALTATSDGCTALVGDKQGALWAWDLTDPASKPVKLTRCKHTAAVACLAAAPPHSAAGGGSGLLLAGYVDGTAALLDWQQDRLVQRLERHAQEVQCVRWAAAPDAAAAAAVAAAKEALSREKAAAAAQEAEAAAAAAAAADSGEAGGSQQAEQAAVGESSKLASAAEQQPAADNGSASVAAQDGAAMSAAAEVPPLPPADAAADAAAAAAAGSASADPVAAAAAALQAAQQALAATPPAWEVLLSSGADGALRLYSFPSSGSSGSGGSPGSAAAPQLQLLTTLRLPRPPPGLPTGQSNRLWFSAAVVPPPLPEPGQLAATGRDAPATAAAAAEGSQPIWLVSSGHAGTLLAWKVPLPSASAAATAAAEAAAAAEARAAAFGRRGPAAGPPPPAIPAVHPSRLPISHGRTVFTVHAASVLQPKPAAAVEGSPSEATEQQEQQEQQEEKQPVLQLLTTSMDRSVFMSQLPHPGAAAAAAEVAAPSGSWRRDAAVGAAASAAWHKLALTWRLTGLGGHVYSLSLLEPLLAAASATPQPAGQHADEQQQQQQQQDAAGEEQQQGRQQHGRDGEVDSVPPPPPPPPPADLAEGEPSVAAAEPPPPPPPPPAEPSTGAEGAQPQQLEQQKPGQEPPAAAGPPPDAAAQQMQQDLLLMALGCGDRTLRVQPVPAPGTPHTAQQTAQLLLWQNIPDRVTAVAWQPLLPAPAAAAAAAAPGHQAAAAAGLAFGCGDGSLGIMLPSQERSMLLPVKHKGAVTDLCWTLAPTAPSPAGEQPAVQLYSLSADGALLLWGPVPLPLIDLFSSGKAASGSTGSSAASWSAPGSKPAAAALACPVDLRAQLAAAAADSGAATSWLSSPQQLSITAFAVLHTGSPAAGAVGSSHLVAAAFAGGGVAVFGAASCASGGSEAPLRLLWASSGAAGAATISHICFSADGWQLAAASDSGAVSVHPWAAEASLLPADVAAAAPVAAATASVQLDNGITALAWTPGSMARSVDGSSSGGSTGSSEGDSDEPGCGNDGILAVAVLLSGAQVSGGIQLLDLRASSGSGGVSHGRLVPTALLRGHSAPVRCLKFLPPQDAPQPQHDSSEQQQQGQGQGRQQPQEQQGQEQEHQQPEPQAPAPQPPRRFLLTGSEDQSVRLYDIQRQLAAWQQRQAAAAAAAAEAAAAEAAAAEAAKTVAAPVETAPLPVPAPAVADMPAAELPQQAAPDVSATAGEGAVEAAKPAAAAVAGSEAVSAPAAATPAEVPPPPPPVATPTAPAAAAPAVATPAAPAAAVATPAAPAAAVATPAAPAAAAVATVASKKKAAASSLGSRPILPAAEAVNGSNLLQQREAQQACLELAQQLIQEQSQAEAAGLGSLAAVPAPPCPASAALLDCAPDPLTASLSLHQAAADLGAAAATAQSAASRLALAQRAAAAALFRGDVGAAMQLLLEHDALTADFVSLSAAAGPAAWRAVTLAWAAKLEQQLGEPHLAALHLLAAQEVEGAVQVYRRAGLLREALTLAAARLLPGHPLLQELHAAYAAQLAGQGQQEQAAAHYLAAGQWAAAAAVLLSRGSASGAAAAVRVCQQGLASGGALPEGEQARLQQQLEQAELALAARAAAEGTTAAAALAALEPAQPAVVAASAAEAPGTVGGAARSGAKAGGRQRYSAQQLMAVSGSVTGGSVLPGLPEDLAASATATQPAAIPRDPAVFGRTGASRQRYSLQALLELSVDAEAAVGQVAARQALPSDLRKQDMSSPSV